MTERKQTEKKGTEAWRCEALTRALTLVLLEWRGERGWG